MDGQFYSIIQPVSAFAAPTHVKGYILDLVLSKTSENLISNVHTSDASISDHFNALFQLNIAKLSLAKEKVSYRKLGSINSDAFSQDIAKSSLRTTPAAELPLLVKQYN